MNKARCHNKCSQIIPHRLLWLLVGMLLLCGLASAEPLQDVDLLSRLAKAPTAREYPNDNAVWLLREMEVSLDTNGALTVHEHKLLKLLNAQSLSLANWQIPYDKSAETLAVPVARTLLNGQAFPVEPTQVVESALYPGLAWYDTLMVRRFPLPAAMVGATLEVESTLKRNVPRMSGDLSTRLQLQDILPICEGRFTLRVPSEMHLAIRFTGRQQPKISENEHGGYRVYAWTIRNVPALRLNEPQLPSANDLIDSARVTSWQSWEPVVKWYANLTAEKAQLSDDLRKAALARTEGCASAEEKIAALHKMVRQLPYVAVEMGDLSDTPHDADEVFRRNYGDCKDKATLLRALLQAVGIQSDYVLVRTTERGPLDRQLFGPAEFDHVILAVRLPGGDRFLDATLADAPADRLPPGVEGADALIIRGKGELVTLPLSATADNKTDVRVTIAVKADRSAAGTAVLTYTGQSAVLQRGILSAVTNDQYREALEGTLAPRLGNEVALDAVDVQHLREPEQPLVITVQFSSRAFIQPAGEQLSGYLPIFMYQANRYRSTHTRLLPFQQHIGSTLHEETTVTCPPELPITSIPAQVHFTSPFGEYRDTAVIDGQTIRFTADLTASRGQFPPEMLEQMRQWSSTLALEGRNQMQFFLRRPDKPRT